MAQKQLAYFHNTLPLPTQQQIPSFADVIQMLIKFLASFSERVFTLLQF